MIGRLAQRRVLGGYALRVGHMRRQCGRRGQRDDQGGGSRCVRSNGHHVAPEMNALRRYDAGYRTRLLKTSGGVRGAASNWLDYCPP